MAWALALVVWAPALAEAQQSGLFPLHPIRRERVPCPMEDPIYRLNREQYYGYFPTCWRRFPPGWGCPSPEAPDLAKAFRDLPLEKPQVPPPGEEGGAQPGMAPGERQPGAEEMPGGAPRPDASPMPPLPPRRSPFEPDSGAPGAKPPAEPAPPTEPAPSVDRPKPADSGPGLLEPTKPSAGAAGLFGPIEAPTPSASRAPVEPRPTAPPTGPSEPLLALPDPSAPSPSPPSGGNVLNPASIPPGTGTMVTDTNGSILAPFSQPPPAQAPTRRGPIGTFFNGLFRR